MQVAQLSNVKPDSNYPDLVTHLQTFPRFWSWIFFFLSSCACCLIFKDLFAFSCLLKSWTILICGTGSGMLLGQPRTGGTWLGLTSGMLQYIKQTLTCSHAENQQSMEMNSIYFHLNATFAIHHISSVLEHFF